MPQPPCHISSCCACAARGHMCRCWVHFASSGHPSVLVLIGVLVQFLQQVDMQLCAPPHAMKHLLLLAPIWLWRFADVSPLFPLVRRPARATASTLFWPVWSHQVKLHWWVICVPAALPRNLLLRLCSMGHMCCWMHLASSGHQAPCAGLCVSATHGYAILGHPPVVRVCTCTSASHT